MSRQVSMSFKSNETHAYKPTCYPRSHIQRSNVQCERYRRQYRNVVIIRSAPSHLLVPLPSIFCYLVIVSDMKTTIEEPGNHPAPPTGASVGMDASTISSSSHSSFLVSSTASSASSTSSPSSSSPLELSLEFPTLLDNMDVMFQRAHDGAKTCKAFSTFLQQSAVLEEGYGSSIVKVGTMTQSKCAN